MHRLVRRDWLDRLQRGRLYRAVATLLARRARVTNASMYPLLRPGEVVPFDRLAYRRASPSRGEIVLVEDARLPAPLMIKLVAALPGERVTIAHDRLLIDGRPLSLPGPVVGSERRDWLLGIDEYFLMSYNVAVGTDSRHFGPVPSAALRAPALRPRLKLLME